MKKLLRLPAFAGVAMVLAVLLACSPALNWRQVELQDLKARLPCKPDNATRPVTLGGATYELAMMGCEADGALFAVSHIREVDAEAAAGLGPQWQVRALEALQATDKATESWHAPRWAADPVSISAVGRNAQGKPVQARLTWLRRGADVYHFAVYAETLTDAMTQPFLEDLQAP